MGEKFVAVIGAVNVDIFGRSLAPLIARDSNPGELRISMGGVGRNIAHNMRLLGLNVQMLTAIGMDSWSAHIEKSCGELGIGLERAIHVPEQRTSTYLCITGPDGDLALGLSDMDIVRHIDPAAVEKNLDMLNKAELVVFDGNLSMETIDCITSRVTAPLFADPVSVTKARKIKPFLSRIHTLKPNSLEAQELTGESLPEAAAEELVQLGVKRAFVSDGAAGIVAAHGLDTYRVPCFPTKLVNATGGGDAAMAALCRAFVEDMDMVSAARYALAAGAMAVEYIETINPNISHEALLRRVRSV